MKRGAPRSQSFRRNVEGIIWRMDLDKIEDMNVGKIIADKTREINKLHGTEVKENKKRLKHTLEQNLKKVQKENIFDKKLAPGSDLKFNQLSQEVYMELRQKCKMFEGKAREKEEKVFRSHQEVPLQTDYTALISLLVRDKIKFFDYKELLQDFLRLRNKLLFQKIKNNSKQFDFQECQLLQKIGMEEIAEDERALIIETLCEEHGINLADLLVIPKENMQPFLREKGDRRAVHLKVITRQLDHEQLERLIVQDENKQNQNLINIFHENQREELCGGVSESNLLALKKKEIRNKLYDSLTDNYKNQIQQTINEKRSQDGNRFFKKVLQDKFTSSRTSQDFLTPAKALQNNYTLNTNTYLQKVHKQGLLSSQQTDSHLCPRYNPSRSPLPPPRHFRSQVAPLACPGKKRVTSKQLQVEKQQQKKQFRQLFNQFTESQQSFTSWQQGQSGALSKMINNLEYGMGILKYNTMAIVEDQQEANLQLAAIKTEKTLQRYILEFLVDTLKNKQEFFFYYQQELLQRQQEKEIQDRVSAAQA